MKKASKQVGRRTEAPPSRASLREMPEVSLKDGTWRPNPYAARIAKEGLALPGGVHLSSRRGRPKKGEEVGPTTPRSVRFPAEVWERLEEAAKREGLPLHAALRTAIIEWVTRSAARSDA